MVCLRFYVLWGPFFLQHIRYEEKSRECDRYKMRYGCSLSQLSHDKGEEAKSAEKVTCNQSKFRLLEKF